MSRGTRAGPASPKTTRPAGVLRAEHGYLAIALLSFLLIAFSTHLVADSQRALRDQEMRNAAVEHAATAATRLEAEINSNIFLASGLATYVSREESFDQEELRSAMRSLAKLGDHVRNIGIAVGYSLTYIYPEAGNEEAIGLYYPDVPSQWPDVKRAIEARSTVLAGPLELAQGGQGIISRTPVFTEDGTYWGILSLVLNAPSVFEAAGLMNEAEGYRVALRQNLNGDSPGPAFLGDESVFRNNPVTIFIALPGNRWEMAVVPVGGWTSNHMLVNWAEAIVIAVAVGICVLLFYFLQNRNRLRIRNREKSAILNTSREGIIVLDAQDNVLEANAAACAMFARNISDILGKPVSRIIDFKSSAGHEFRDFEKVHREAPDEDTIRATGHCARRGDFPMEIRIGQAQTGGRFMLVCALRDISADQNYERKLIELATIDPLTRAFNRRSFMVQAEKSARLAERHGRPMALLVIDADHFKTINDTFGHATGDSVLTALGSLIRSKVRRTDIFGRIGGEEFALLLPETQEKNAHMLAGKLTQAVEDMVAETASGEPVRFTVSIGVASSAQHGYDFHALLQAADRALYRAKEAGRNRYAV